MTATRELGRSGLQVAPVAFGGNVFGWTIDEHDSLRVLSAACEAGITSIDTAPVLIIGTTRDPATPYAWAKSLRKTIKHSKGAPHVGEDTEKIRKEFGI